MIRTSKELPVEKNFAKGLAEAVKNHGYFNCVIDGNVYCFFTKTYGKQAFWTMSFEDYDNLSGICEEMTDAGCKPILKGIKL